MSRGHAPEWVGTVGTTMYLVRAGSEDSARQKVFEMATARVRQKGLLFVADEIVIRRAKPLDILTFADAGMTSFDFEQAQ